MRSGPRLCASATTAATAIRVANVGGRPLQAGVVAERFERPLQVEDDDGRAARLQRLGGRAARDPRPHR